MNAASLKASFSSLISSELLPSSAWHRLLGTRGVSACGARYVAYLFLSLRFNFYMSRTLQHTIFHLPRQQSEVQRELNELGAMSSYCILVIEL